MKWNERLGLIGSAIALATGIALFVVAAGGRSDAHGTLATTERLHEAQLAVAEAEADLGGTDLGDAILAARRANQAAVRVGHVTARIVKLLHRSEATVGAMLQASERGASGAIFARDQTRIAASILAAINSYQAAAERYSGVTNRALERVLRALRETNRSFPGGG